MKKIVCFISLFLLIQVNGFAQKKKYPLMQIVGEDTLIVFHIKQAQELIKINEQKNECKELLSLSEQQLSEKDKIIDLQQKQIKNNLLINTSNDNIIKRLNDNISIEEEKHKITTKEMKRQRNHKVVAVIGLICVSVLGIIF